MGQFNICGKNDSCPHKKIYEESYIDQLVSLYKAVTSDETIPSEEKTKIINIVYILEIMLEQYSA